MSVLDRLGEPVHRNAISLSNTEEYCDEYHPSEDSLEYNDEKVGTDKGTSQLKELKSTDIAGNKKSKREKRDKKEKKEKKKLKELKKLEKKLKKLKAKKRQKSSDLYDSEASETEEDYDDTIEYFMSGGDDSETERSNMQSAKERNKSKRAKSSPNHQKIAQYNSDSNKAKKQEKRVEDSDDELFAFFEKDEVQLTGKTSSSTEKKIEPKVKERTSSTTRLSLEEDGISKKKHTNKINKPGLSKDESSLMNKMKKKNEKTMKRQREIEEDKLFHR